MNAARPIAAIFALAFALGFAGPADACRIGWDQHLFNVAPPQNTLAGADIIHVRITKPDLSKMTSLAVDPRAGSLPYSLIGEGRIVSTEITNEEPFPIYAFVTSCSVLMGALAPPGEYYLVGRFAFNAGRRSFFAGGRRVDSGGDDLYGGWHY